MKKIIALILALFSTSTLAFPMIMPDGSTHTQVYNFNINEMVPANTTIKRQVTLPQLDGNTVWTSIQLCSISVRSIEDIRVGRLRNQTEDDRLIVDGWVQNLDFGTLAKSYYFINELRSWRDPSCTPMEIQYNPIHMFHNLIAVIRVTNESSWEVPVKASLRLLSK